MSYKEFSILSFKIKRYEMLFGLSEDFVEKELIQMILRNLYHEFMKFRILQDKY